MSRLDAAYPEPRYTVHDTDLTSDRLREVARTVVQSPPASYVLPRYGIRAGERVLIVVPREYDRRVLDALVSAIEEVTSPPDVMIDGTIQPWDGLDGAAELFLFREFYVGAKAVERSHGFDDKLIRSICAHRDYDVLLYGSGGSLPSPTPPPARPRRYGLLWSPADYFASGLADFPTDLQKAIDSAAWRTLAQARTISVRDPEGTEISWSLRPGDIELTQARLGLEICMEGHLNAVPFAIPVPTDATGTIAGTINHAGAHPRIELHVDNGKLVSIEGGGDYGAGWRDALETYADVHWPGHPGPGWCWLMECAIGTNPKALRSRGFTSCGYRTTAERLKAGTIHFGLGVGLLPPGTGASKEALQADKVAYRRFIEQHGVPDGHHHVHLYFATLEVGTAAGEHLRLIENGRLTALDDPEVRAVAARHGDADALLAPAWTPTVPGINAPGDYLQEYAVDPGRYILERSEVALRP